MQKIANFKQSFVRRPVVQNDKKIDKKGKSE